MLLAKFEFDEWFHFFKNKKLSKNRISLKPDDVIVMSSNVHEWKGKPRSIVCYQCFMQQIIKTKLYPIPMIVRQYIATLRALHLYIALPLNMGETKCGVLHMITIIYVSHMCKRIFKFKLFWQNIDFFFKSKSSKFRVVWTVRFSISPVCGTYFFFFFFFFFRNVWRDFRLS